MIELFEREARSMTLFPDGSSVPRPASALQSGGKCYSTAPTRPRLSFGFGEVLRTLAIAMADATALIRALQGAISEHREQSLLAPSTHLAHPSATTKTWYQNQNV